jgi:oxygen-independent coproporphyrinogen-3 oxidase
MRTVRHKKPENYLRAVARNGSGIVEEAVLSPNEAADEALVMGLRLREGVDLAALAERFGFRSLVDTRKVDPLLATGLLKRTGSWIALTASGRLLLDRILGEIVLSEPIASAVAEPKPASPVRPVSPRQPEPELAPVPASAC